MRVDCQMQEVQEIFLACLKVWRKSGHRFTQMEAFHSWFGSKTRRIHSSVVSPNRQGAGLGFPPDKFTTNRSERTNSVLQDCVNAELPELTNTP